jgi:hypothetical protein
MFQYAAARSIAELTGQTLKLDVSGFQDYGLHNGFELARIFAGDKKIASENDVCNFLGWQAKSFAKRLLSRSEFTCFRKKKSVPLVCYLRT